MCVQLKFLLKNLFNYSLCQKEKWGDPLRLCGCFVNSPWCFLFLALISLCQMHTWEILKTVAENTIFTLTLQNQQVVNICVTFASSLSISWTIRRWCFTHHLKGCCPHFLRVMSVLNWVHKLSSRNIILSSSSIIKEKEASGINNIFHVIQLFWNICLTINI